MHELACAFVCRRNVDLFVTDLNETVINGIVGHFSCVFVTTLVNITVLKNETYNGTVVIPVETTLKPSKKSCSQIDSSAWLYGVKQNYYPTLCRSMTLGSLTLISIRKMLELQWNIFRKSVLVRFKCAYIRCL